MKWNNDEIEFMHSCLEMGWKHKEIALELNRTVDAVAKRCSRLDMKSPKKVKEDKPKKSRKLTTEEYISRLPRDIVLLQPYKGSNIKILHKNTKTKEKWYSTPTNILYSGSKGTASGFDPNKRGYCYCIYFPGIDLYKVGITNNVKRRLLEFGREAEIIFIRESKSGYNTLKLEQKWLKNLKDYKVNTGLLYSGNTETFKF